MKYGGGVLYAAGARPTDLTACEAVDGRRCVECAGSQRVLHLQADAFFAHTLRMRESISSLIPETN